MEWLTFLNERDRSFQRNDIFFSRIIAEVRRSWVKNPGEVKDSEFLLDYEDPVAPVPKYSPSNSKNVWLAIVGAFKKRPKK